MLAGPVYAQDAASTADPPKKHHHHRAATTADDRLEQLEKRVEEQAQEIDELKARLSGAPAQQEASQAPAQPEVTASQFEALQNQVYEQQAAETSLAKNSWWGKTSISGRMYFDLTDVDQKNNVGSGANNGTNFDIKRFYVGIDHQFDDVWSANVTTDFTYDSGVGATQLYLKKAYLQAKLDKAAIFRAGSFDMPWIPFAEDVYGYRYVENTLIDRIKYGNSADWGVNFSGSYGDDLLLEYSFAAVNGAGYKKPGIGIGTNRTRAMDFEGRLDLKYDGFVAGIGGYDGMLGKDTAPGVTHHDATRFDAIAAYVADGFHVGVEYFYDNNFDTVTSVHSDNGEGWSGFAAYQFTPEWALFGRYDSVDPTRSAALGQPNFHNDYYNVGIEWTPTKIVNLALVYKHDAGSDGHIGDSNGTIGGTTATTSGHYDEIGLFGQFRW